MISTEKFTASLLRDGYSPYICVPCSFQKSIIDYLIDHRHDYIQSTSEGEAVGIAAGAYLAGRKPVVIMQNSGLCNAINPITSLCYVYNIPALLLISLRGEPGIKDEPQHVLMGEISDQILDVVRVPHAPFPENDSEIERSLEKAGQSMQERGLPFAFVMKKNATDTYAPKEKKADEREADAGRYYFEGESRGRMARIDSLRVLSEMLGEFPIVSTTGKISRELFTIADRENQFYTVGSMGCAASIGFGVARYSGAKRTVVLDGDGAVLMKMGTLALISYYRPAGLIHVVLDNECYDSTGGQPTLSSIVDIAKIALACGYRSSSLVYTEKALREAVAAATRETGPHMILVKVAPGSIAHLGRPTVGPREVALRFSRYLREAQPCKCS